MCQGVSGYGVQNKHTSTGCSIPCLSAGLDRGQFLFSLCEKRKKSVEQIIYNKMPTLEIHIYILNLPRKQLQSFFLITQPRYHIFFQPQMPDKHFFGLAVSPASLMMPSAFWRYTKFHPFSRKWEHRVIDVSWAVTAGAAWYLWRSWGTMEPKQHNTMQLKHTDEAGNIAASQL